jgi:hypothetical protein
LKNGIMRVKPMKCLVWVGPPSTWCWEKLWKRNAWEVVACCVWCGCWMSWIEWHVSFTMNIVTHWPA